MPALTGSRCLDWAGAFVLLPAPVAPLRWDQAYVRDRRDGPANPTRLGQYGDPGRAQSRAGAGHAASAELPPLRENQLADVQDVVG